MNIFVLTGAGVSAESGLGTFRDKAGSGIWAKFDPMKLATPEAFAVHPEKVHAFYNMRRRDLLQAEPTPPTLPWRDLRSPSPCAAATCSRALRTSMTCMSVQGPAGSSTCTASSSRRAASGARLGQNGVATSAARTPARPGRHGQEQHAARAHGLGAKAAADLVEVETVPGSDHRFPPDVAQDDSRGALRHPGQHDGLPPR